MRCLDIIDLQSIASPTTLKRIISLIRTSTLCKFPICSSSSVIVHLKQHQENAHEQNEENLSHRIAEPPLCSIQTKTGGTPERRPSIRSRLKITRHQCRTRSTERTENSRKESYIKLSTHIQHIGVIDAVENPRFMIDNVITRDR